MKKILCLLAALLVLCGCTANSTNTPNLKGNKATILDEVYNGENTVYSDLSLKMALAILIEGASGTTLDELENFVFTDNLNKAKFWSIYNSYEEMNEQFKKKVEECNARVDESEQAEAQPQEPGDSILFTIEESCPTEDEFSLYLANGVFVNDKLELVSDFKERITDICKAKVEKLDFGDSVGTTDYINQYVEENTNHMIKNLFEPGVINEGNTTVIVNTLYFKDTWKNDFSLTKVEKFTNLDESKTDVKMLLGHGSSYYENDYAEAFSVAYSNGLMFYGILPKNKGDFNFGDIDFYNLIHKEDDNLYSVTYKFPEFKAKSSFELNTALQTNGVRQIFDDSAQLNIVNGGQNKVDKVIQKVVVDVNEKGTEASAATGITTMYETSMSPREEIEKEVFLDRPFSFVIYDPIFDVILFSGKIVKL